MSKERSGAAASVPSETVTPSARNSGAGQRPETDISALGLCATLAPVRFRTALSASVRSTQWASSERPSKRAIFSSAAEIEPSRWPSWTSRTPSCASRCAFFERSIAASSSSSAALKTGRDTASCMRSLRPAQASISPALTSSCTSGETATSSWASARQARYTLAADGRLGRRRALRARPWQGSRPDGLRRPRGPPCA